jgi:hypothetical protein
MILVFCGIITLLWCPAGTVNFWVSTKTPARIVFHYADLVITIFGRLRKFTSISFFFVWV